MSYERKNGQSALFVNTRHPDRSDLNGQVDLLCECGRQQSFWINAWRRVTQGGTKYLALQFKPKDGRSGPQDAARADSDSETF